MPGHIALFGDSIFDNAAYTRGEPDVVTHLRRLIPAGWQATLCAVDGSIISSIPGQLRRLPDDCTHIVIAVGGNDALAYAGVLRAPVRTVGEGLASLAGFAATFERSYRTMLTGAVAAGRRVIVCTIYNGWLPADEAAAARAGLTLFNDAILRSALDAGTDVIELRRVCCDQDDYANPIEPSGRGGLKIARAIAGAVGAVDLDGPRCVLRA